MTRCQLCGESDEYPDGPRCSCFAIVDSGPEPTIEDYCDPHPYHGDDGDHGRCYCGLKTYPIGGRPVDQYGRPIYADHEVPPVDAGLSVWRGGITKDYPPDPGKQVSGCHPTTPGRRPYAECFHGWVRSLDWWLHCADCHPAPEPRCPEHGEYPLPCAVCSFALVPTAKSGAYVGDDREPF